MRVARLEKPDVIVWKGDPSLPRTLQGIRVLGAPIGSPEHVAHQLEKKSDKQETLFTRIPRVQGHPGMLVAALDVCFDQSKFLVAHGHSRTNTPVRRTSRCSRVGVFARHPWNTTGT